MTTRSLHNHPPVKQLTWLPIIAGLLLLYLPTYVNLARTLWTTDDNAHGPLILAVSLYFAWSQRRNVFADEAKPRNVAGAFLLFFGLVFYVIGHSQTIWLFEVISPIFVIAGTLLLIHGVSAVRALWFPLFFLIYTVPLPGVLVDTLTQPLKQWVSLITVNTLFAAGYPIARNGVTLIIGPYQLLVADACSGMHSMFSLSAIGVLYLYLMGYKSWLRNGILLAVILPIAFAANVTRVIVLVLVTYHLGDAAGQGFLHGFAGMVLFVASILLLFGFDKLLAFFFIKRA